MMLRTNMILLLLMVCLALGAVTAQYRSRKLFQALEAEQERDRQLDVEYDQLQSELSSWAAHPRIEKIARERLKMALPPSRQPIKSFAQAAWAPARGESN